MRSYMWHHWLMYCKACDFEAWEEGIPGLGAVVFRRCDCGAPLSLSDLSNGRAPTEKRAEVRCNTAPPTPEGLK